MAVDFSFYLITDSSQTGGRGLTDVVRAAVSVGVSAVQFREKTLPLRPQLELAYRLREITSAYGAKLFVNDRVDIALAVGADGIQLPASGLPLAAVQQMFKGQIGVSCHTAGEVKDAESGGADFALLGPVYDTPSKRGYGPPLGVEGLKRAKTALPLFAVGGIQSTQEIEAVFAAGASGIAMISGVMRATSVEKTCQRILRDIQRALLSGARHGTRHGTRQQ